MSAGGTTPLLRESLIIGKLEPEIDDPIRGKNKFEIFFGTHETFGFYSYQRAKILSKRKGQISNFNLTLIPSLFKI